MAADLDFTIEAPSEPAEWESSAVSLQEAAERLGLTESEVLLRVFRRSLPSVVGPDGNRRVPLAALDPSAAFAPPAPTEEFDESDEPGRVRADFARLTAQIEVLDDRLRDAYARIAALESREQPSPLPEDDRIEVMAGELALARARIAALETRLEYPRPLWLRHWEACCRWLNVTT